MNFRTAWCLGLAGLAPMLAGLTAMYTGMSASAWMTPATLVYGGLILSFMGGTHWGLALYAEGARDLRLMLSVLPSLFAWPLLFAPERLAAIGFAAGFAALYLLDAKLARQGQHHPEYWRLRQLLSAAACLCYLGLAIGP
jgi:hypothetical protein